MVWNSFKLALRNVFRNKRRTLLTLASITVGGAAIILVGGYIEYSFWGLRESTIRSELGHIQYYRQGFNQNGQVAPGKYLLNESDAAAVETFLKSLPEVRAFSRRLSATGLISAGEKSLFFFAQGIEPEKESRISSSVRILAGSDLFEGDRYKILVGQGLADQLQLAVGDRVTLLVTTYSGAINALDFTISGIMSNGVKAFDEKIVRMPLPDMQELLSTHAIERIVVLLRNTEQTQLVYGTSQAHFGNQGVELKTWEELADFYQKVKTIYQNIFRFLNVVILIVIVLSIINTMTMSVMERISEIGTLRAMGTSRSSIMLLMVLEGFILGVIGGACAMALGCVLALAINVMGGVYMPPPPGHTIGYMILIKTVPSILGFTMVLSIISAVLSSVFPAIKAAGLNVVEAIRHV